MGSVPQFHFCELCLVTVPSPVLVAVLGQCAMLTTALTFFKPCFSTLMPQTPKCWDDMCTRPRLTAFITLSHKL